LKFMPRKLSILCHAIKDSSHHYESISIESANPFPTEEFSSSILS
jgi:hypothetical protein